MTCVECAGRLDVYLDGELSVSEMQTLGDHVRGCPACASAILERVQTSRAVALAGKRYSPSAEFRQRVQRSVGSRSQKAARRWFWAPAGALALLIGFLLTYQWEQRQQAERVLGELADLHVATLASANPVDVMSSDRHTVKPWFQGKLPFTFDLPELPNSDFTLLGGRMAYLGQSPGAELIYQIRQHRISVFLFQNRGYPMPSGLEKREAGSFTVRTWTDGNLLYVLVGDAAAADVGRLAELLKSAARG
jgi:anti-sigma factor RsiW